VVEPFDVEECCFDAVDSIRLPHRQSGSSPQDLTVTLIADYTLSTRVPLPTPAIVALLGEFGMTTGAARTTVSRLTQRGVLAVSRQGRKSFCRLTEAAAAALSAGGAGIATFGTGRESWDGLWTVVVFAVPKEDKALPAQLRRRGYAPLDDGAWVSPHPLTDDVHADLVSHGTITAFRAEHLPLRPDATRDPIEAWDLTTVATEYEKFVQHWEPVLPRIRAGRVTGAAAVRARTEAMDAYRRFPAIDPLLPAGLLPPDWPRTRARDVFLAVYDGLALPALRHVRAVISRVGEVPRPELRTHTLAELAAGI